MTHPTTGTVSATSTTSRHANASHQGSWSSVAGGSYHIDLRHEDESCQARLSRKGASLNYRKAAGRVTARIRRVDADPRHRRTRQLQDAGILALGRHTYGNPTVPLFGRSADDLRHLGGRVLVGSFCSLADCTIFTGGNHHTEWVTTYPLRIKLGLPGAHRDGHPATKGDVIIGNDVWVGNGATILSGVTIGDGAVVAAEAVVANDVPPYAVVAGNPARLVRYRFSEDQIRSLLEIQWWNWPDVAIVDAVMLLCSPDIDGFIRHAEEMTNSRARTDVKPSGDRSTAIRPPA